MLTGKCKKDFIKYKTALIFYFIPRKILNYLIFRWFNIKTEICIDLQNWQDDGFDFAVQHPYLNKVYQSQNIAGNREKNFDKNIESAIKKANQIYNDC